VHNVVTDTDEWKDLAERTAAHEQAFAAWRTDHDNRMRPYHDADAAWLKKYKAFAAGEGKHPGQRPSPPRDTLDLSGEFARKRAQLIEEQEALLARLWPRVEPAAHKAEEELLGRLRASLAGEEPCDWAQVMAELQDLAQTVEVCSARATRTTERPGRPMRRVTVTPERLFLAAWFQQGVLGLEGEGPSVTMVPADVLVDPDEVRAREAATPPSRPVRSTRHLDASRGARQVIGTGEGVDANLIEQVRRNAASRLRAEPG
jgi:hypothetical protein